VTIGVVFEENLRMKEGAMLAERNEDVDSDSSE